MLDYPLQTRKQVKQSRLRSIEASLFEIKSKIYIASLATRKISYY